MSAHQRPGAQRPVAAEAVPDGPDASRALSLQEGDRRRDVLLAGGHITSSRSDTAPSRSPASWPHARRGLPPAPCSPRRRTGRRSALMLAFRPHHSCTTMIAGPLRAAFVGRAMYPWSIFPPAMPYITSVPVTAQPGRSAPPDWPTAFHDGAHASSRRRSRSCGLLGKRRRHDHGEQRQGATCVLHRQ